MSSSPCLKCLSRSHRHPTLKTWFCKCDRRRSYLHPEGQAFTTAQKKGGVIKIRHGESNRWEETFVISESLRGYKNDKRRVKACGYHRIYMGFDALWERVLRDDVAFNGWSKWRWIRFRREIGGGQVIWLKTSLASIWRPKENAVVLSMEVSKGSKRGAMKMKGVWEYQNDVVEPFEGIVLGNGTRRAQIKKLKRVAVQGKRVCGVAPPTLLSAKQSKEFIKDIGKPMHMR